MLLKTKERSPKCLFYLSLFNLSTLNDIEDNCDYLDIDSRMQLENDPNSLTLIQLNQTQTQAKYKST